jgi:hypothetical protein
MKNLSNHMLFRCHIRIIWFSDTFDSHFDDRNFIETQNENDWWIQWTRLFDEYHRYNSRTDLTFLNM